MKSESKSLKRRLGSLWPKKAENDTDIALAVLKATDEQQSDKLPTWVQAAVALGVPSLLAAIVAAVLQLLQ